MSLDPFTIAISESVLDDLRDRLSRTRSPDGISGSGDAYGLTPDTLSGLVSYWRTEFDWRSQENYLNTFSHHRTDIDGIGIHFVLAPSSRADAIPLLMLHGWPSSFIQMLDIVPLLTEPEEHLPAFHVVIPSLPGFGFSDRPTRPGMSVTKIAPLMHALMTGPLGYSRYGLRSSDLGAGVASSMALSFGESIIGSHMGGTNPYLQGPLPTNLTSEEERFVENAQAWMQGEMAYAQIHASKPQTLAVALNDSPAGLAAWIGEKFLKWSDNQGRIEDALSLDGFFANLTIYWATETINSSMRLYYETFRDPGAWGSSDVPVGYLMPIHDLFPTPRSWMERQGKVEHWTEAPRGGHFLEWEQPQLVANDLRTFFGGLSR